MMNNNNNNNNNKYNILFICTSSTPGLWLHELSTPFYIFQDVGYNCDIASISNSIVVDNASINSSHISIESEKFMNDQQAQLKFQSPYSLENIINNNLNKYQCVYLCGGHGCCKDFINNNQLTKILEHVYNVNKGCLSAICHGALGLLDVKDDDKFILKGKFVCGFTNEEENELNLLSKVPILVEDSLDNRGCFIVKGAPFTPKACVDGRIMTAQNPQSSKEAAERTLDILRSLGPNYSTENNVNKPWGT